MAGDTTPGRVLVVDDSLTWRSFVIDALAGAGHLAVAAESGEVALAALADRTAPPPDLVLLDVVMPGLGGAETCRLIRQDPLLEGLPILFVTGDRERETILECFAAGGDDYVIKDDDAEVILARVGAQLRRRQLETDLAEKNRELERSNRELDRYAHVIAHDLRSPLTRVRDLLSRLHDALGASRAEEAGRLLDAASGSAERMTELLGDLLAYARVGGRPEQPREVDTAVLVGIVETNLAHEIEHTAARVRRGALPTVQGQPALLVQLFQNLVENALKYRSERPPEIEVGANRADGAWQFEVRDNGIGVEPRHANRIFDVFERVDATDRLPGSGIGLAIARKIVETHGGRIWLDTPGPSPGATFRFTLPVVERVEGP